MKKHTSLAVLIILGSCSFKKSKLENQTKNGHTELYSRPEAPKKDETEKLKRIVIAATNDIHGHYESQRITLKDRMNPEPQTIEVGGVDFISSYFKILRQQYGQVLLLDSGDIFSDRFQEMDYVSDFYKILDYDAVTIGLKDFNIKLPPKYQSSSEFFKEFSATSKTPLVLSNLYELKTARVVEWPGTLPYLMKEINGVKVGIIGLVPDDFVDQTPLDNRIGLYVENMLQSTLRHSRLLRSLGAEIIVVITHQGVSCGEEIAQQLKLPLSKVNFEPEKSDLCDLSNKMGQYLNRLPHNLVDVIIGGRNHQKTANFINDTLVLSNFENGQSFTYAELFVDAKTKKLQKEKTIVHQPIMFCHEFFKETNDCYSEDSSVDHKVRINAKFLGQEVHPDTSVIQKFQSYLNRSKTSQTRPQNVQTIMDFYDSHLTFQAEGSKNSKLVVLDLKGSELISILENDYNQGLSQSWKPTPFKLQNQALLLSIQGSPVETAAKYRILASIEDLQSHSGLKDYIGRTENRSLNSVSWNEPRIENDDVSTLMSGSETVR